MQMNSIALMGGGRIGYIDALRGFSMILVVFGHVLLMMGFPTDSIVLGAILLTFRMPLFFFVSGFFAFRLVDKWTPIQVRNILKRKVQAQVICTVVFYSLFQLCHSQSPLLLLTNGFSWFWFTIVLFQMFLIYLILAVTEHYLKCNFIVTWGLIILSVLFLIIHIRYFNITVRVGTVLSWGYLVDYFQYFTLGILCRKYYHLFERALSSNSFRTFTIIIYVASLLITYGFDGAVMEFSSSFYRLNQMIIVRYAGLATIFILFFSNSSYFNSDQRVCKWLKFVGRRTLDIYMLHVFVLPNLIILKPYLTGSGMLLSQLTIGIIAAIINIAVCLFLSTILRCSTTLSQWLFGEKTKVSLSAETLIP